MSTEHRPWWDYDDAPRPLRSPKHTPPRAAAPAPTRRLTPGETALVSQAHRAIKRAVGLYSNLCGRAGFEPEDAVQEIVRIFCQRIQGSAPYDPTRASLPNYCTMLTRSVLINRLNKRRRRSIGFDRLALELSDRVGDLDVDALSDLLTPEETGEPVAPWFHG